MGEIIRSGCQSGRVLCAAFVILLGLSLSGCSYPQAAPENRELIAALRTACSARNGEWLDQTVTEIEARKAAGTLTAVEYDALMPIARKAQSGDWTGAEHDCFEMQADQRPTAEELAKIPAAAAD